MKRLLVFSIQLRHLTATNHSAEMGSSSNRLTSHTLPLEPDASKLNANGSSHCLARYLQAIQSWWERLKLTIYVPGRGVVRLGRGRGAGPYHY